MKTRWGRLAFGVEDEEYTLVELMVLNDESSLNLWTVGKKMFSCWENSNSALRKRSPGWQIYRSMILTTMRRWFVPSWHRPNYFLANVFLRNS